MSKSSEASWVATRTVGAQRPRDHAGRGDHGDGDRRGNQDDLLDRLSRSEEVGKDDTQGQECHADSDEGVPGQDRAAQELCEHREDWQEEAEVECAEREVVPASRPEPATPAGGRVGAQV